MKSANEMRQHLADKAAADQEFRNQLLSDPKGTIEQELDITIPEGIEIRVHEDDAQTAHLILPPSPRLSETQLAEAAGGGDTYYTNCM